MSSAGSVYGAINGLTSGNAVGQAGGALTLAGLANKTGALGNQATNSSALGAAGGVLGLYQGIQQGGTQGDLTAASGALRAGQNVANLAGDTGLSGALGAASGVLGAGLGVYNFAKNYQSGATGTDTALGAEAGIGIGAGITAVAAETGAEIGTDIFPGFGTLIGAAAGALVGAASSAFGGGKPDTETLQGQAADKAGNNVLANQSPSTSFQYISGIMDGKNDTAGHASELEQVFGRGNTTAVVNGMSSAIDSAIGSGQMTVGADGSVSFKTGGGTVVYPNAQAAQAQVYSDVVQPWLTSKGVSIDPNSTDVKGNAFGQNLEDSLTNLAGEYMSGTFNNKTQVGIAGQVDTSLPTFA